MFRLIVVALVATLGLALLAVPAHAQRTSCANQALLQSYSANYHMVRKAHGTRAPGRNIRKWGLSKSRQSKCSHLRKSRATLRRMRHPGSQMLAPGKPYVPPAQTRTLSAPAGGTLERIAACESGGNPSTNTGNGFYGKYQFTQSTWNSVGGSGNPAAASEAEQDKRAAILYAREGASPWPVCGR